MTLDSLLETTGTHAARRADRPIENLDAVYDDQLWVILQHYRLLEPLDLGQLHCYLTGIPLTRQNIGGLIGTPDGPKPIVDSHVALESKD